MIMIKKKKKWKDFIYICFCGFGWSKGRVTILNLENRSIVEQYACVGENWWKEQEIKNKLELG